MADSSGASTPRGKARADPEIRIDMEPPKEEHRHVDLRSLKGDADASDRSVKSSARGHKPSASVPSVPVLQHLRSFVDTPASHEFRTEAPHHRAFLPLSCIHMRPSHSRFFPCCVDSLGSKET